MEVATVRRLTYQQARVVLDAGLAAAESINVPAAVAVLDAGRETLAFGRQDYAPLLTGELAIAKAFTAISLRQPSGDLAAASGPSGDFFALQHGSRHPLVTFAGGFPFFVGRDIIGAVGASGGSVEEDIAIGRAALAAFEAL